MTTLSLPDSPHEARALAARRAAAAIASMPVSKQHEGWAVKPVPTPQHTHNAGGGGDWGWGPGDQNQDLEPLGQCQMQP